MRLYCCPITQQEKNLNKVSGDHILDIRNDIYWNKLELFHKNETSEKLSFNFEENTIFLKTSTKCLKISKILTYRKFKRRNITNGPVIDLYVVNKFAT